MLRYIKENDIEHGGAEVEGNKYLNFNLSSFAGEDLQPHLAAGGGN